MCRALLLLSVLLLPASAAGQDGEDDVGTRSFTVTAGVGTSMGWYGAQLERYLGGERVSVFGGVGYAHPPTEGHPRGMAFAVGARLFSRGPTHRRLLALTVGQLVTSASHFEDELVDSGRHYGPGLLGGYQYVSGRGFTVLAALGLGYAPGLHDDDGRPITPALDLGIGYTWR